MRRRKKTRFWNTKPERQMKMILRKLKVIFKHQYRVRDIQHSYPADFYIPSKKLIIEVDGKFWHNFPMGNYIDHIRTNEMRQAGYKVVRFWENGFDLNAVRNIIRMF